MSILGLILMGILGSTSPKEVVVFYFYLPFELGTLGAVTPPNIEVESYCTFRLRAGSETARQLIGFIDSTARRRTDFESEGVRMKIVGLLPYEVFVDVHGAVLHGIGGKVWEMSSNEMAQTRVLMERLADEQKCRFDWRQSPEGPRRRVDLD